MTTIEQPDVAQAISDRLAKSGKPRLKDIASIANISVATASMALADHPRVNDNTKRRVREIGKQIGYRVRPRPHHQEPHRVGLMVIGGLGQDSVNTPLMMQLSEVGYTHSIRFEYAATPPDFDQDELLRRTLEFAQDLDGILLVGEVTTWLLDQLASRNITTVVLGDVQNQFAQPVNATVVTYDTMSMGYLGTKYLLDQGHRHIAFACEVLLPGLSHDRWLKGYQMAYGEAGILPAPSLIHITGNRQEGLDSAAQIYAKLNEPPTGFIVPDTRLAASLVDAMKQRGRPIGLKSLVFDAIHDLPLPPQLLGRPHFASCIHKLSQEAVLRLIDICRTDKTASLHINIPFEIINMP